MYKTPYTMNGKEYPPAMNKNVPISKPKTYPIPIVLLKNVFTLFNCSPLYILEKIE
jgi:hypothetical protein